MFEFMDSVAQDAVIKVMGVGGGGGNAVKHMVSSGIDGVDFICANTDAQALTKITGTRSLQIGCNITKGLGAGATPEVGQQAALEDRELIQEAIANTDMLFVTAGMGGGTGTGAAPIVAQLAREMGILVVGVVTKPFTFEGPSRMKIAMNGIKELTQNVDSLITIPNDKLLDVYGRDFDLMHAFNGANDVLCGAVQGITELITNPGVINVDFADVRTVMSKMGMGMMGSGKALGDDRAEEAAHAAVASPLLEDVNLSGARGILVNVTGANMTLGEFQDIGAVVSSFASDDATVVMGTAIDDTLGDELRVTVVATGLGMPQMAKKPEMNVVPRNNEGDVDYGQLEKPAVQRRNNAEATGGYDEELLDIPAFLRRQAD
ncbi:MAG: cell division protein FtsZ [Gammaproteobacteria bacterium]|nr:cell division protein FtsZ [Gammaproteobacteria bacterium]